MPFPTLSFSTLDEWQSWIDNNIIPNGMELITGNDGNITENAAVYFIKQSPLNWQTADIFSSGGAISVLRPINVIMTSVPTSITWGDNIYNEWVFINTTGGNIPSNTYYDINLSPVTSIPAKSTLNVCKVKNGQWIIKSLPSSGSGTVTHPYVGVVDRGLPTDPVSGTSQFQNNSLIGLGASNNNDIQIVYAEILRSSYGVNQSFIYYPTTGIIDLNYNSSGEQFFSGYTLQIDLNQ